MEITCDMAMDLAELYICGAASGDSSEAVRHHLRGCPECRRFYEGYKRSMKKEPVRRFETENEPEPSDEKLEQLSKRLRRRRIFTHVANSTLLTVGAVMLTVGAAVLVNSRNKS